MAATTAAGGWPVGPPCYSRFTSPSDAKEEEVELIQTVINAVVVTAVGLILGRMVHGLRSEVKADIAGVRSDMGDLRSELKSDMGDLRSELKSDIAGLRSEIAQLRTEVREDIRALRSDLTQVALAVGAQPRAENQ
jgi:uncharacterized protein YlxW (UPF0749 family)